MKLRNRLSLMAASVLVVIAACVTWAMIPRSAINRETFERIQKGMTAKQVEDMIGLPPGHATPRMRIHVLSDEAEARFWHHPHERNLYWGSNDSEIIIALSREGIVTDKMFYELVGLDESVWDRVRRWCGLEEPSQNLKSIRGHHLVR